MGNWLFQGKFSHHDILKKSVQSPTEEPTAGMKSNCYGSPSLDSQLRENDQVHLSKNLEVYTWFIFDP